MLALVGERQTIIGLNEEAMSEWIEYRKEKKKPLSPRALGMCERFLLKYSEAHQWYLVEQAIMNDWQGLERQKPKANGTSTKSTSLADDLNDRCWA